MNISAPGMAAARVRSRWFFYSAAIIPLAYTTATVDPAYDLRALLLAALTSVGAWSLLGHIRKHEEQRMTPPWPLIMWGTYATFTLLSIAVSNNSGEAIFAAAMVLLAGAFFAICTKLLEGIAPAALFRGMAVLACLLSVMGLCQFFDLGLGWIPGEMAPYATMTVKNLLSSFLFLLFPAAMYLAFTEQSAGWRLAGIAGCILSLACISVAHTRAVWLAMIAGGAIAGLLLLTHSSRNALRSQFQTRALYFGGACGVCLLIFFVFNVAPRQGTEHEDTAAARLATLANLSADSSANMRLTVWKKSLAMAGDHLVLGVGAGNWAIELPHFTLDGFPHYVQDGSMQWTHPHNDFLAVLCETGVGGLAAYIAIFFSALLLSLRGWRRSHRSEDILFAVLCITTLIGFAIISFLDFPKERIAHTMLFIVWLSLICHKYSVHNTAKNEVRPVGSTWKMPSYLSNIALILVLLTAAAAGGLAAFRLVAETHERDYLRARQEQDWPQVIAECNKTYSPKLLTIDALSTPILYYRAEAEFMQQDYAAARLDNEAALRAHPYHFYTLNNLGTCWMKLCNFDLAELFYKRALAISPHFEESLRNLAALYFNRGQYGQALRIIAQCDTTQPGSSAQIMARVIRSHQPTFP